MVRSTTQQNEPPSQHIARVFSQAVQQARKCDLSGFLYYGHAIMRPHVGAPAQGSPNRATWQAPQRHTRTSAKMRPNMITFSMRYAPVSVSIQASGHIAGPG